ncbi:MAG: WXG100 family type VII secretion target [Anaerolineales bacterium]
MPTIHMDVDQVTAVLALMTRTQAAVREITGNLNNAVLVIHDNEWKGNAELEFYKEYEDLDAQLKQQIGAMETLIERMRQEIAEWEAMAARLA